MKKVPVPLKQWPERIGHSEGNTRVPNVREGSPLFALLQQCCPVPTTWAGSGLARVVYEFLFVGRSEHLCPNAGVLELRFISFRHQKWSLTARAANRADGPATTESFLWIDIRSRTIWIWGVEIRGETTPISE